MKYLFYLGHPAHYHLFKNTIKGLLKNGHKIFILIKKKDILENLIKNSGFDYVNIQPKGRKDSRVGIALGLVQRNLRITFSCLKYKPDLLIGTSVEIAQVGYLLKIPSVVLSEDDFNIIPLFSKLGYPFASTVLSPISCFNGKWEYKSIKYNGFHKLAYLHPNQFTPDKKIVEKYVDMSKSFFILRFAKLTAHHDKGKTGITNEIANELISRLSKKGRVLISSEREIDSKLESYRLNIDPIDIHHLLYYADLYIGDSQSMAVESAILGTPGIRFNDFAGKIGVLEELEHDFGLTTGIPTTDTEKLYVTVDNLLNNDSKKQYKQKRSKLLLNKIDVTSFFIWFFENYPKSKAIMEENPDFQLKFK